MDESPCGGAARTVSPVEAPVDLRDIETRDDVERLVRAFYTKALADPVIGFIFTDVARLDLEAHLPVIASFWETILLDAKTYDGAPFAVHAALHEKVGLQEGHFQRWLGLWFGTVDELFAGERSDLAKVHALRVAQAFLGRLRDYPSARDTEAPDGLTVTQHGDRPG